MCCQVYFLSKGCWWQYPLEYCEYGNGLRIQNVKVSRLIPWVSLKATKGENYAEEHMQRERNLETNPILTSCQRGIIHQTFPKLRSIFCSGLYLNPLVSFHKVTENMRSTLVGARDPYDSWFVEFRERW